MDPHLQRLQEAIASSVAGLSAEQLTSHPPGKWSAAEIIEHLYLTYTGTLKGLARVAEAGKSLATTQTWKQRAQTLVALGFGYLPTGREAPPGVRPRAISTEKVLAEIGSRITEMNDLMARCEVKFGTRCKLLDHPVLGPLTAAHWREFHLLHGMHHIKQIRRLNPPRTS